MTWMLFDYGVGNLHSLRKALQAAGAQVDITQNPQDLQECAVAVLPGVGAFGTVMQSLEPARQILIDRHAAGRPIFGVCIGQQVLYEGSDETPGVAGLGLLSGHVRRLPASAGKVPHMGWNQLEWKPGETLLAGLDAQPFVYYVHSYAADPTPATLATTRYGTVFTAAAREGHTVGVQFHPEKSSRVGATILRNIVQELEAVA
jgi:imidazole glycerol-phosphate synthase subunit HisH